MDKKAKCNVNKFKVRTRMVFVRSFSLGEFFKRHLLPSSSKKKLEENACLFSFSLTFVDAVIL